mgnify:CR=1 FL=1
MKIKKINIISWNVNGIRAIMKKNFSEFLQSKKPDIILLQEVKIAHSDRLKANLDFPGYTEFWNSAQRPGYSGTAIFIRENLDLKVISEENKIGIKEFDNEGRTQILEFEKFFLINSYFPNTRSDLSRLDFKIKYNQGLQKYIKKLQQKKPVIITGDFNVAHEEIDLARPKANDGEAGFHPRERAWMSKFLDQEKMLDTFRLLHPKTVRYSWWSYRARARERDVGWRIDYFCVSKKLKNKVKKAEIWNDIFGSDHCPVYLQIEL